MATTTSLTTSYVGEAATELINKMFFGAYSIKNQIISIKDDVNKSWKIRRLAGSGLLAAVTCDFTPAGTVTIDERSLDVTPFEANIQLCKKDFKHVDWSSVNMGTGMGRRLSQDIVDAMIEEILGHLGTEMEYLIWRGDTTAGTYNLFDGIYKKILADVAAGNKTTHAAITASNVMTKIGEVYTKVAGSPISNAEDLVIYAAKNVAASYKQALAASGYLNLYQAGDKPLDYLGIPMWVPPGLADDAINFARKSGFYFGTESVSDVNEVTLKDMSEVDLSDNVRFKAYAAGGVQYGWADEIFFHPIA